MIAIGTTSKASAVSLSEVTAIIAVPPTTSRTLRMAIDAVEPTTTCSTDVSAVSRDRTSPVRVASKNCGDRRTTLANTALRMSAATRSPSHDTK